MNFLYDIIKSYFSYSLQEDATAENNLLKFQLPAHDTLNFYFVWADGEFSCDDAICSPSFVFAAMVDWNVAVYVDSKDITELWDTLVNLNKMKLAAMLTQQLLNTHFKVEETHNEVAPKFKQFVVSLPESDHAKEFIDTYTDWVRLAEEISFIAVNLPDLFENLTQAGDDALDAAYFLLHTTCFSALQFDPDWCDESHRMGPFVSYSVDKPEWTRTLFYALVEDQKADVYIEQSIQPIVSFLVSGVLENILETTQQGGCFESTSLSSWLNRK